MWKNYLEPTDEAQSYFVKTGCAFSEHLSVAQGLDNQEERRQATKELLVN